MANSNKKETRGGKKPLKYGEETTTVFGRRIPISKEQIYRDWHAKSCKTLIDSLLKQWEINPDKQK